MSVIVKGMEMPESCRECRFLVDYWCYAKLAHGVPGPMFMDHRPDWCPLVELPEKHGRLIDIDALPQGRVEWEDIDYAPIVVEAEGD